MGVSSCRTSGLFCLLLALSGSAELRELSPFLEAHCYECHGPEKQKGEIRLDTLGTDLAKHENLEIWQAVLDQLNLGEMPPEKREQPEPAEVEPVVELLTADLAMAYETARSTGGRTVLRRLNRHELRNTFRDLLYLQGADYRPDAGGSRLTDNNGNGSVQVTGRDPLRFFPEDEEEDGFFNLGERLVMSDFLLKLTLGAAEEVLEQATHLEPRPAAEDREFVGRIVNGRSNNLAETLARDYNPDFELMSTGYDRYGRLAPSDLSGGVGLSARYRITVEASAHNQDHSWGELLSLDEADPFQLCLNIADSKNGGIAGSSSTPLALWSLPADGSRKTFKHEVWMDKTWTPWLGWENGPSERDMRPERLVEYFYPDAYYKRPDAKVDKAGHAAWHTNMACLLVENGYAGPHIRIHRIALEPLIDSWPPRSHTALYGSQSGEESEIRQLLSTFAERAFRRPVAQEEIEPFVQLVLQEPVAPVLAPIGGLSDLRFKVYEGKWSKLPDFASLTPAREGKLPSGYIDIAAAQRKEYFAMSFEGRISAPARGQYLIEMASDDGARILIDDAIVLEHDGLHGAEHRKAKVQLAAGEHRMRVEYLAYGGGNSFRAGWSGPGFPHTALSAPPLRSPQKQKQPKDSLPPLIRKLQDAYIALLCSPKFLYLKEDPGPIDDYAIASRLSYFLWSSMPDEQLFALAKAGKLSDPAVRSSQVDRMLEDERAAAFVRHFPSAWLRLDKLGKMPPSGGEYQFYRNLRVEPLLLRQVTLYFEDILANNGRIDQFIDADYAWMNHVLGKWIYRREDIRGHRFRKVALNDPRRGGIFTHPGVMTATANGVDTSPVIRGTWVLENVLGTPPAPPPPDVEPLPTDTREASTIREQLALHRKHEACNACHRKIDPMGFAFENFDVVGRWRERYKGVQSPINPSATLANGREVADIIAFKQMLKDQKPLVVRCLTQKMLTYATGRQLEAVDRGEVERIVSTLAESGDRLRDLVHLVVESEIFLNK
jgi:hypothetical protein